MKKIILSGLIGFLFTGCGTSSWDANKAADAVKNKFESSGTIVCYDKPSMLRDKKYAQMVSKQDGWELVQSDRSSQGYIFKKDIEEHLPSECVLN